MCRVYEISLNEVIKQDKFIHQQYYQQIEICSHPIIFKMWRVNQLQDPIPQSSSSRQAGGISIPPLRFDSSRQSPAPPLSNSIQSSNSSTISVDKLKLFYTQKIHQIQQIISQQTFEHQERRVHIMNSLLSKNGSYTREEVKEIILKKDIELDQMLDEFYEARVMEEEAKLGLVSTFPQTVTVTDLVGIINDLMKKRGERGSQKEGEMKSSGKKGAGSSKQKLKGKSEYDDDEFNRTIDTLTSQNDIVADKLRAIIQRRRGTKTNKTISNKSIPRPVISNQRLPTFTNLNSLSPNDNIIESNNNDSILTKIFNEIQKIKIQISSLNGKIDSHHLSDKTIHSLEKEYHRAIDKVQLLEHQIEELSKELTLTHSNLMKQEKKNQQHHQQHQYQSVSKNPNHSSQWQLSKAMQKVVNLQQQLNQLTSNFTQQTQKLQQRIDSKDKKIKQLTEAINTMKLVSSEKSEDDDRFENEISNQVDELMEEIDRLRGELEKSQLESKGYQLQIMRMGKVIEDKDEQIVGGENQGEKQEESEVEDNDLIKEIQRKCEDMASENQKAIQDLDKQREIKQQKLKDIYTKAAQKSSRTNQSKQKDDRNRSYSGYDSRVRHNKTELDEGLLIDDLNYKIHKKIEELRVEKERNRALEEENLELKEEILVFTAKCTEFSVRIDELEEREGSAVERGKGRGGRGNVIAQIIDGYDYEEKVQMVDCFSLLIKILSDNVEDGVVIARCENLLRCAEGSREDEERGTVFEKKEGGKGKEREREREKVDSIPTLEYKKEGNGKGGKRKPVA